MPLGQVHRQPDIPGARVHHAAGPDHHRAQLGRLDPRGAAGGGDRVADQLDRVARAVGIHGHLGQDLAGHVGHAGGHRLGGDVEAGHDRGGRHDRVHRRAGPPDTGLLPGDLDQPALLEAGERLRGGDLRQAGALADLRAGQRPLVEQQFQRRAIVDLPKQARCAWPSRHRAPCLPGHPLPARPPGPECGPWLLPGIFRGARPAGAPCTLGLDPATETNLLPVSPIL